MRLLPVALLTIAATCPFAYVSGQKIDGAAERAGLLGDMKEAYSEKCR